MHSIRTKITAMTVGVMIIVMTIATGFGVTTIREIGRHDADQILLLLCQTGEKNLDHYFQSVEQSVKMVSAYVESDLDSLEEEDLQAHLDRVSDFFEKLTFNTSGLLTYYYRIDPDISTAVEGFWYVNLDGNGFRKHRVTDLTQYNTVDTSGLVWFSVPKVTGKPVWLPPYITDNLGRRVVSYNVPVYLDSRFVGVIGIEIDYSFMADEVNHLTLYDHGYAFLNDAEGNLIYHPHMDVTKMKTQPTVPEGLLSEERFVNYRYEGVEKRAVWLPLSNGMRLNISVPVREINEGWQNWSRQVTITFAVLLLIFAFLIMSFVGRITRPLRALTRVAEQMGEGNYECSLDYDGKDEVGILTRTFRQLTENLKRYISDLNDLAYADSLTSLHNKGAFDICVLNLQKQMEESRDTPLGFAVCIFDCNGLKDVNDENGHDKGDIYLKETSKIICEVFDHSPVFRIGGDEFAAVLTGGDYLSREELLRLFDERCAEKRRTELDPWQRVDVARGMAVYNPREDQTVNDVVRRADRYMYEHKWRTKKDRQNVQSAL